MEVTEAYYYTLINAYETTAKRVLSEEVIFNMTLVFRTLLGGGFAIFGMVSNIVNITVFYRQGPMATSTNVILTGLAIFDFWLCFFAAGTAALGVAETYFEDYTWSWFVTCFDIVLAARPMNATTTMTSLTTTVLTLERAISVTLPFKVKFIFTPKRCIGILIGIFLFVLFVHLPNLGQSKMSWSVYFNVTRVGFSLSHIFPWYIQTLHFYASPVFLLCLTMVSVVTCNVIIIWKVQSSKKFRSKRANAEISFPAGPVDGSKSKKAQGGQGSAKEIKLLRMILVVSSIFSLCNFLNILQTIIFVTGVGIHWTTEMVTYDMAMFFQIFNSSINAVIYYTMSTRYREDLKLCWENNCCRG